MPVPRFLGVLRARLRRTSQRLLGFLAVRTLRLLRRMNRQRTANFAAAILRTFGPWTSEHRVGRANLQAAFPDKSAAEIETILRGVWDNLGRVAAEFPHIDKLHIKDAENPGAEDIIHDQHARDVFFWLRDHKGQPALLFTAHLANWELPAYVAGYYDLDTHILYRRPNIGAVHDEILAIRSGAMGTLVPTGLDAPIRLLRILEGGSRVAMLVDQYNVQGVDVTFFGRTTKANPVIARLAQHVDCPIYGVRVVRLPDRHRFHIDITDPITPVRAGDGTIDIAGTMQVITGVVEGWVREHPDQWLWLHRRWR